VKIAQKAASRILGGYHFVKRYSQHLPQACNALFSLPCAVTRLEGILKDSDERITVLYVGRRVNYQYLLRIIFDEYREIERKVTNLLAFRRHMDGMSAVSDVLVLDLGWPYNGLFKRRGDYVQVPDWVNMVIELPERWDDVVANFRRTARKHDLRLIRRNGYRCELADSAEAIETFYDEMYVPFVTRRHAAESVIASRRHVIKRAMQGKLLHVLRGNEIVAAGVIYPEGDIMFSLWMGVPETGLDLPPEACISALYFFGIRYAFDNGYKYFDFTGTRAFLKDGAFQFKRRWGPVLEDAFSPSSILIKPQNDNRKAALFCQQVPVMRRSRDGLEALVVRVDEPVDEGSFIRLEKEFGCTGLARITVIEISDRNETRTVPLSDDRCEYRWVKTSLDKFSNCYSNADTDFRSFGFADLRSY
jgi:hypothetical protein